MRLASTKSVRRAGVLFGLIAFAAVTAMLIVWHERILPQKTAIAELGKIGAICLYDFEYDFLPAEGRIPNYGRPPTPSLILRTVLGKDWFASPVYVQCTGDEIGDGDVAVVCDLLTDLPTVRHLNLRGTLVTDKSCVYLRGLQQLTVLDVRESALTADGVKSVETALQGCRVLSGEVPENNRSKAEERGGK